MFFSEGLDGALMAQKAKRVFSSYVSVIGVVTAVIVLAVGYYYLSRTGNEGQVAPLEMSSRSFLENILGVRPRTKEFLIGNPLFILGTYLCIRHRLSALNLFIIGVITQADMVGSFTHLHTPIRISLVRTCYGMFFGAIIGLLLILILKLSIRS